VPHSCHAHDLRPQRSGHRPVRDIGTRAARRLRAARALARTMATSWPCSTSSMSGSMSVGESSPARCRPPYIPLLLTVPGVARCSPTRSRARSATSEGSPVQEAHWLHRLCPIVRQSGNRDVRGPLAKNGPKYLRWRSSKLLPSRSRCPLSGALRAQQAPPWSPAWREGRSRRHRPPPRRGRLARLTKNEPFAPAGPRCSWSLDDPVWNWAAGAAS